MFLRAQTLPFRSPARSTGPSRSWSNDKYWDYDAFGIYRRTPISQELNLALSTSTNPVSRDIGFYIFTVDGANVTADYYAVTVPVVAGSGETDPALEPRRQAAQYVHQTGGLRL